jgi:hypothetical protein
MKGRLKNGVLLKLYEGGSCICLKNECLNVHKNGMNESHKLLPNMMIASYNYSSRILPAEKERKLLHFCISIIITYHLYMLGI